MEKIKIKIFRVSNFTGDLIPVEVLKIDISNFWITTYEKDYLVNFEEVHKKINATLKKLPKYVNFDWIIDPVKSRVIIFEKN